MTINEVYQQLDELQLKYSKAIDTITKLQNKIARLQRENEQLKEQNRELLEENKKLRKLNNILYKAMEIAVNIENPEAQTRHLKKVLEKLREETREFKG
ncbi:hypothetical protein STK_13448 [Sulfurisphaera tokodaii str. 7]|uniref:Cell division protein ZapB n=1 Tax=Sulfurisphaera tokodaii (strain DSM 16993 / JCM 10545 / NBRC 100140 / 7) TaxID=273063 RepID=Q971L3_SULTO|nr:cell division protein ZapB [Sulfurisphaera tokodaii]BAB66407.1 hypothetical protein STK_13448 [Sulfurisphaera tokodaii str. 7]